MTISELPTRNDHQKSCAAGMDKPMQIARGERRDDSGQALRRRYPAPFRTDPFSCGSFSVGKVVAQLFQNASLLASQLGGRFHFDVHDDVAPRAAVHARDAFVPNTELRAGLRAFRNAQRVGFAEGGDLELRAEAACAKLIGTTQWRSFSWRSKKGCSATFRKT